MHAVIYVLASMILAYRKKFEDGRVDYTDYIDSTMQYIGMKWYETVL